MLISDTTTKDQIERGEVKAPSAPQAPPRRSWDIDGEEGASDFTFVTKEGAVISCQYAKDLEEFTRIQDALLVDADAVAQKGQEFEQLRLTAGVSPKELLVKKDELAALVKASRKNQFTYAKHVVEECVIGWEGAPKPFSIEARSRLPFELCVEFMQEIINNSQLSEKEGGFLSSDLTISSQGAV